MLCQAFCALGTCAGFAGSLHLYAAVLPLLPAGWSARCVPAAVSRSSALWRCCWSNQVVTLQPIDSWYTLQRCVRMHSCYGLCCAVTCRSCNNNLPISLLLFPCAVPGDALPGSACQVGWQALSATVPKKKFAAQSSCLSIAFFFVSYMMPHALHVTPLCLVVWTVSPAPLRLAPHAVHLFLLPTFLLLKYALQNTLQLHNLPVHADAGLHSDSVHYLFTPT